MAKYPHFKIDFLNCKINVICDKDWRNIARKILKRPLSSDSTEHESNAMAIELNRDYYILSKRTVADSVICHECFHILMWVAAEFNLKFDVDNQEPMAYLLEYIIEKTLEIKKRRPAKKKRLAKKKTRRRKG